MPRTAALLLASALIAPATALARPMTSEDVMRLEQVGTVQVAPDGSRVAYTRAWRPDITAGGEDATSRSQLFLTTGAGQARAWLPEDVDVGQIRFSPDGGMISFLWADEDGKRGVWGIPTDGGAQRKLAAVDGANIRTHAWSPDARMLYLLADAAEDERRAAENKAGFDAIVYEEEQRVARLFTANVPADAAAEMDAEPRALTIPGSVSAMQVSSDGRWAAIESAPTPLIDDDYTAKRVHILDLASGEVTRVIETPGKIGDVEISPDGRQLSLIAAVDANDPAPTTLHLVDVATGAIRALNAGEAEAAADAEWLADGRLAAAIDAGADSVLRFYTQGGEVERTVDPGELIIKTVESGGNRVLVKAESPTHPQELFLLEGQSFTRWTESNPWLSEITFAPQRTLIYTARDGREIEGILIEPLGGAGAAAGGATVDAAFGGAPTIMMVHGGPEAHYSNGWLTNYSQPGQVAAGQGYAVFHPNYRGSTAYGVAFAKEHQGDYAGVEFDDIVDAKGALVDMGIADAARTGITGGSYGGFASAWGATRYSEEYAAAVMFVGISNNLSKFGTTDIPNEMYLVHERKWPWEEWERLLERSPIFHAGNATTPLLIMHGEEDTRVSPTQSYELYRNIKVRRPETPVRLVLYPDEGHGNRGSAAQYDYNLRMMRWFDTYLKTGDRSAEMPPPRPTLAEGAVSGAEE